MEFKYHNVGKGVALNTSARIEMPDGEIHEESIAPILQPGQEVKRVVEVSDRAREQIDSSTIWVEYADSLGNSYKSKVVPDGYRAELYQLHGEVWQQVVY